MLLTGIFRSLKNNERIFFKHLSNRYLGLHTSSENLSVPVPAFSLYKDEHEELRKTVRKLVEKEINPYVDQWEEQEIFPARAVFKKFGEAGLLGITRSPEYGGLGLDYSFTMAFMEELGTSNCGGVPMAIAVHTDCSTPALAKYEQQIRILLLASQESKLPLAIGRTAANQKAWLKAILDVS